MIAVLDSETVWKCYCPGHFNITVSSINMVYIRSVFFSESFLKNV